MVLPRFTNCELVEDPTRLVATHRYSPASVDVMLLMVSDWVFKFPPEYFVLSVELRIAPLNNQYTAVNAGESCVTLALQWMVTVVAVSVIVPGTTTVGFSKMISSKYVLKNCLQIYVNFNTICCINLTQPKGL